MSYYYPKIESLANQLLGIPKMMIFQYFILRVHGKWAHETILLKLPTHCPVDNFGTVVGENPTPHEILALWAVNGL